MVPNNRYTYTSEVYKECNFTSNDFSSYSFVSSEVHYIMKIEKLIEDYLTWYLWSLKSYIKDMQRTEFRLALLWLICISETSDLIQSSAVHWESAYMCTKTFLHEKNMSYFLFFCMRMCFAFVLLCKMKLWILMLLFNGNVT